MPTIKKLKLYLHILSKVDEMGGIRCIVLKPEFGEQGESLVSTVTTRADTNVTAKPSPGRHRHVCDVLWLFSYNK